MAVPCRPWRGCGMPHADVCFQPKGVLHPPDKDIHRNPRHHLEVCPWGHPWPTTARSLWINASFFLSLKKEDGSEMYFIKPLWRSRWVWIHQSCTACKHILVLMFPPSPSCVLKAWSMESHPKDSICTQALISGSASWEIIRRKIEFLCIIINHLKYHLKSSLCG